MSSTAAKAPSRKQRRSSDEDERVKRFESYSDEKLPQELSEHDKDRIKPPKKNKNREKDYDRDDDFPSDDDMLDKTTPEIIRKKRLKENHQDSGLQDIMAQILLQQVDLTFSYNTYHLINEFLQQIQAKSATPPTNWALMGAVGVALVSMLVSVVLVLYTKK